MELKTLKKYLGITEEDISKDIALAFIIFDVE